MTHPDKPSSMLHIPGQRDRRWYPHEALMKATMALAEMGSSSVRDLEWHLLSPEDAAAQLPELRRGLAAAHRFVAMIEAIADERGPVMCADCSSQFYPSRSDAVYCSASCRQRAYRRRP
jgi:hypothetical protein